jgi:heme a synthase
LALFAWYDRVRAHIGLPVTLPTGLVGLVVFQALLGMWTVTLRVHPVIVTAHLIGGLATLALLGWLALRQSGWLQPPLGARLRRLRPWAWGGLALLGAQILLGGWTSTHYAAVACIEFPTCYGDMWWPPTDFREGFTLWRELGANYEFGVLDSAARTAIHLTHRLGALLVVVYLGALASSVVRRADQPAQRAVGTVLGLALLVQIGLGIATVVGHLPLPIAVAHNGGAAWLLLSLVTLLHILTPDPKAMLAGAAPVEKIPTPRGTHA